MQNQPLESKVEKWDPVPETLGLPQNLRDPLKLSGTPKTPSNILDAPEPFWTPRISLGRSFLDKNLFEIFNSFLKSIKYN